MTLKSPHWLIIACTIIGATSATFAGLPIFAPYAAIFGSLAAICAIVAGGTGVVSHSALTPATPTPVAALTVHVDALPAPPPLPNTRGFVRMRALAMLSAFALGCGLLPAAVPGVTSLAICVYDYVKANAGLTLLEYVAQSIAKCGGDALTIIDDLIASTDPALASVRAQAKALKASGGVKLQEFAASAHARAGAIRGETK
jgi:hypothetical protein